MKRPADETTLPRQSSRRLWCSERFLSVFSLAEVNDVVLPGAEAVRRKRVLDFVVFAGGASARIADESGEAHQIALHVPELPEEDWHRVFGELAQQAIFLASLLAGTLPAEIEDVFRKAQVPLFPESRDEVRFTQDGTPLGTLIPPAGSLIYRLCERLDEDPFAIFIIRGRGHDETIAELRRSRRRLIADALPARVDAQEKAAEVRPTPFDGDPQQLWRSGHGLRDLSYTIKADELPAALLKRLDPLPLSGYAEDPDMLFEDAYAHIARRAQAFGLALKR